MRAFIFVIIILVALLSIVGIVVYYFYEVPSRDNVTRYESLSLIAKNSRNEIVKTDYIIGLNSRDNAYSNGTTLKKGYLMERLPVNNTLFVYNVNREGQNYYSDVKQVDTNEIGPFRVDLRLIENGSVYFSHTGNFGENDVLNLTLNTDGIIKDVNVCLKWSFHIIKSEIDEPFLETNKPFNLSDYDKCYGYGLDLENNEDLFFNLKYNYFGEIDNRDFIKLAVFDINENKFYYEIGKN